MNLRSLPLLQKWSDIIVSEFEFGISVDMLFEQEVAKEKKETILEVIRF